MRFTDESGWKVGLWTTTVFVVGVVVGVVIPEQADDLGKWLERHERAAAWVQGFAAVVALVLAIAIPWGQSADAANRANIERENKIDDAILSVVPELIALKALLNEIDKASEVLAGYERVAPSGYLELAIGPPKTMEAMRHDLHLLRPVHGSLIQLLTIIHTNDRMIERMTITVTNPAMPLFPPSIEVLVRLNDFRANARTSLIEALDYHRARYDRLVSESRESLRVPSH